MHLSPLFHDLRLRCRMSPMKVGDEHYRTIWLEDEGVVSVIDQNKLPFQFEVQRLITPEDAENAIRVMTVRGAGLIGATAGFGMYLAAWTGRNDNLQAFSTRFTEAADRIGSARPTASNLQWAVKRMEKAVEAADSIAKKVEAAQVNAMEIADYDAEACRRIGKHGKPLIEEIARKKDGPVNVLTHCNAGWLAFVDYGSATSPIYAAHDSGINVHVWVDETRPRNQGASLTSWELLSHGVPHSLVVDNAGGHLMQHGLVDIVIVGADRVTRRGDAANKIGTYLKALAANDNDIPFYVALPSSTFDFAMNDGVAEIPIEERDENEVTHVRGLFNNSVQEVRICPEKTRAVNYGFDVTPARLISGLITEKGVCGADQTSIYNLFPEEAGVKL